jgi:hypothetical protein
MPLSFLSFGSKNRDLRNRAGECDLSDTLSLIARKRNSSTYMEIPTVNNVRSINYSLEDFLSSRRASGLSVLFFDESRAPDYTLPTGCLLIEHPDLQLLDVIENVPELKEMWDDDTMRLDFNLWLHEGFDSFFRHMFKMYQKNSNEHLAYLIERMKLFRERPLYAMARDEEMRLPKDSIVGLSGLTQEEKIIVVATLLLGLEDHDCSFHEVYVPKELVHENPFLRSESFYDWVNEGTTKLFALTQEVVQEPKKIFLQKSKDRCTLF